VLPALLDRLYISPSKENLKAFEAITQHPILSNFIHRLIYDATEFLPKLSKKQYIRGIRD